MGEEKRRLRLLHIRLMSIVMLLCLMTGSIGAVAAEDDTPTITIGGVGYTEQNIQIEMMALMLEDAGYEVERKPSIASEALLHQAHLSGDIDVSVQYTGSGLVGILGMDIPEATADATIAEQSYDIVKTEFEARFGMIWLDPLGFNNTYALLVTQETADELGVATISELVEYAPDLTLGTDIPFPARPDGLPGVEAAYDIHFGDVVPMDVGLLYASLEQGQIDVAVGYSTDGRIPRFDLVILDDDRDYFPPYYAAPVINQDLLEDHPELGDILNQTAGLYDNETMAELNAQVDEEGKDERDVARAFLEEHGIIGGDD
jgi:glycine betaine/choline ABC-type transport system substrate-binding protein